jgi:multiple sugar transport system ATP-binding protein
VATCTLANQDAFDGETTCELMAAIEFDHVTKRFPDGTVAVDDIELAVADGEFMIFVGPSGCGKTTALRMVAGLEEVTSGEIRIGGRVVNELEPPDRDIAMVFQNYALYPHMSVADNIGFPLRMQRRKKAETNDRVGEVAELLGIGDLLKRRPRELSGGQRQRVAMGRAIIRHPQAFLMDEPLSNLDAKLRVQMRAELVKLHRRLGVTTIYVTHDQTEAMTLGQRVAVLKRGVIQQVDTPQSLYSRPVNTFVAGFIGSPPMNFIRSRLAEGKLELGEHTITLPDTLRRGLRREAGDVLVGLRPEEFADARLHGDGARTTVLAEIEVTEQLGPETLAYFRVEGLDVVEIGDRPVELAGALSARLDPRTSAAPGERLRLAINPDGLHVFEMESGESLIGR